VEPSRRIPIVYIGGYSRSGSTIFQRLLSHANDVVSVGEMWDIWTRSFIEDQLCGCGAPFSRCEFWTEVVAGAFGPGAPSLDPAVLNRLKHSVQGWARMWPLFVPGLRSQVYEDDLTLYREFFARLYRAVHSLVGGKVIVDSSKVPQHAAVLSEIADVELHVVHLLRDSRATAYSWQRKKRRPEIQSRVAFMAQYTPARVAAEWAAANGLLRLLEPRVKTYMIVRYEDFAVAPWETIHSVREQLGLGDGAADEGDVVELEVDHTVSGNPNRFDQGAVRIRADEEWRSCMRPASRLTVTALTLPLLARLGYLRPPARTSS
jgi:hypothetical protein